MRGASDSRYRRRINMSKLADRDRQTVDIYMVDGGVAGWPVTVKDATPNSVDLLMCPINMQMESVPSELKFRFPTRLDYAVCRLRI